MAQTPNMAALLVVVVVALALLQNAAAKTTFIVGDKMGWTTPPAPDSYSIWASVHNFTIGDILFFNFTTGTHNVAKVTKDDFDLCNDESPIFIETTGPANITLDSPGDNYFICTIGEHCADGQMLAITVNGTTTTTPSSPSPSGSLQPPPPSIAGGTPPPPSSAPSTAAAGATFFVMVMSLVINLC